MYEFEVKPEIEINVDDDSPFSKLFKSLWQIELFDTVSLTEAEALALETRLISRFYSGDYVKVASEENCMFVRNGNRSMYYGFIMYSFVFISVIGDDLHKLTATLQEYMDALPNTKIGYRYWEDFKDIPVYENERGGLAVVNDVDSLSRLKGMIQDYQENMGAF